MLHFIKQWIKWLFAKAQILVLSPAKTLFQQQFKPKVEQKDHYENKIQQQISQEFISERSIEQQKNAKPVLENMFLLDSDININNNQDYIILLPQMIRQQQLELQLAVDVQLHELILLTQDLLRDLIQTQGNQCQSIFNSHEIPSISIEAYLRRIHKYTKFSPQCLMIAIIYIDRYNMAQSQFSLNWHNVHRVLLACLMLAVKFNDDIYFDNHTFQRGGGVSAQQLAKFQLQIFQKMDFNAYVDSEQYEALVQKLYSVYASDAQ